MASGELMMDDDVVSVEPTELSNFNREEIDMQVATAQKYKRSIKEFRREVSEMACLDEETAATMFYALPRGGKKIEGPSARFAEVVGAAYGNLRYGSRISGIDGNFIVAEGVCFDVQKNVSATVHVRRRITNSDGKKFNDDMIQVTGNAACSIALRNAIFKVVPMGLVKDIYEQAKMTSIGKATSMSEKRHKMLDWFAKAGATEELILESLGRAGLDDITTDDLIMLRGLVTAIKDGDVTIETAFDQVAGRRGIKRGSVEDSLPNAPVTEARDTKPSKEKGMEDLPSPSSDEQRKAFEKRLNSTVRLGSLKELLKAVNQDDILTDDDREALVEGIDERIAIVESE